MGGTGPIQVLSGSTVMALGVAKKHMHFWNSRVDSSRYSGSPSCRISAAVPSAAPHTYLYWCCGTKTLTPAWGTTCPPQLEQSARSSTGCSASSRIGRKSLHVARRASKVGSRAGGKRSPSSRRWVTLGNARSSGGGRLTTPTVLPDPSRDTLAPAAPAASSMRTKAR